MKPAKLEFLVLGVEVRSSHDRDPFYSDLLGIPRRSWAYHSGRSRRSLIGDKKEANAVNRLHHNVGVVENRKILVVEIEQLFKNIILRHLEMVVPRLTTKNAYLNSNWLRSFVVSHTRLYRKRSVGDSFRPSS